MAYLVDATDEQAKYWTITLSNVTKSMKNRQKDDPLQKAIQSSEGRRRQLEAVIGRPNDPSTTPEMTTSDSSDGR